MDSIEPVRARSRSIAAVDATTVHRIAERRDGSDGQRREGQSRQERDAGAGEDAGEELPSVILDAGMFDGTRAREAGEHSPAERDAREPDAFAMDASLPDASERESPEGGGRHGQDELADGGGDGLGHIDVTV